MKKVLNGKMYNTETATIVGSWDNGCQVNDFAYCAETLYRSQKGTYFLHGESGAQGPYAEETGNGRYQNGEEIVPMKESEARAWAEEVLEADDFVRTFGDIEEA